MRSPTLIWVVIVLATASPLFANPQCALDKAAASVATPRRITQIDWKTADELMGPGAFIVSPGFVRELVEVWRESFAVSVNNQYVYRSLPSRAAHDLARRVFANFIEMHKNNRGSVSAFEGDLQDGPARISHYEIAQRLALGRRADWESKLVLLNDLGLLLYIPRHYFDIVYEGHAGTLHRALNRLKLIEKAWAQARARRNHWSPGPHTEAPLAALKSRLGERTSLLQLKGFRWAVAAAIERMSAKHQGYALSEDTRMARPILDLFIETFRYVDSDMAKASGLKGRELDRTHEYAIAALDYRDRLEEILDSQKPSWYVHFLSLFDGYFFGSKRRAANQLVKKMDALRPMDLPPGRAQEEFFQLREEQTRKPLASPSAVPSLGAAPTAGSAANSVTNPTSAPTPLPSPAAPDVAGAPTRYRMAGTMPPSIPEEKAERLAWWNDPSCPTVSTLTQASDAIVLERLRRLEALERKAAWKGFATLLDTIPADATTCAACLDLLGPIRALEKELGESESDFRTMAQDVRQLHRQLREAKRALSAHVDTLTAAQKNPVLLRHDRVLKAESLALRLSQSAIKHDRDALKSYQDLLAAAPPLLKAAAANPKKPIAPETRELLDRIRRGPLLEVEE